MTTANLLAETVALLRKLVDHRAGYANLTVPLDGAPTLTLDSTYELTQAEALIVEELMQR
jgi:hypothetical protein